MDKRIIELIISRENSELVVSFLEKTQTLDKKYLNVTFKVIF